MVHGTVRYAMQEVEFVSNLQQLLCDGVTEANAGIRLASAADTEAQGQVLGALVRVSRGALACMLPVPPPPFSLPHLPRLQIDASRA